MNKPYTFFVILSLIGSVCTISAQEVKINSNLVVESDGTMRMDGSASVFDDINVYPDATSKGSSNPPTWTKFKDNGSGSQGVFLWMFSPSTEQEVFFSVQIPHSYKEGTSLYPHVHWTTASGTPSGTNVVWGLEYTIMAIAGRFPTTSIITANSVIPLVGTPSGTAQHIITSFGAISGSGLAISTILVCRLFRVAENGSDTFSNAVGFLSFDIHYEKDTQGSRTEYTK